jgi:hypothetical protein
MGLRARTLSPFKGDCMNFRLLTYLNKHGQVTIYYGVPISFEGMRYWKSMGYMINLTSITKLAH